RPIGVSPALAKRPNEDWYRGNKWPPADLAVPFVNDLTAASFPYWAWSAYHFSFVGLTEFVQQPGWNTIPVLANAPIPAGQSLKDELTELQELMDYRPGVMAEALAQISNLAVYWSGLFMFNKASHPATWRLAQVALRVAQFQAMYYKFNPGPAPLKPRPRPSQLSPSLMPPIDVPGHASYPSGHATESYLLAGVLAEVMPQEASTETTAGDSDSTPLRRLAERVARNREVLGLHYPSDSKAGKYIADHSLPLLLNCPSVQYLNPIARQEWP
ncbi:MAG TPA: hypothetical protein VGM05_26195, partial [Planctomycetaceae bacterium]